VHWPNLRLYTLEVFYYKLNLIYIYFKHFINNIFKLKYYLLVIKDLSDVYLRVYINKLILTALKQYNIKYNNIRDNNLFNNALLKAFIKYYNKIILYFKEIYLILLIF
jgi:hypothetical protein